MPGPLSVTVISDESVPVDVAAPACTPVPVSIITGAAPWRRAFSTRLTTMRSTRRLSAFATGTGGYGVKSSRASAWPPVDTRTVSDQPWARTSWSRNGPRSTGSITVSAAWASSRLISSRSSTSCRRRVMSPLDHGPGA